MLMVIKGSAILEMPSKVASDLRIGMGIQSVYCSMRRLWPSISLDYLPRGLNLQWLPVLTMPTAGTRRYASNLESVAV
jgi:hypothetical protein